MTVNEDGSLHVVANVKTASQTIVRWPQEPAALQGKAVYMSQTGADAGKFLIGLYGNVADGTPFSCYSDGKITLPADIKNVAFLFYASKAGEFEFDCKPQLELGSAKTAWERPDNTSWGGHS